MSDQVITLPLSEYRGLVEELSRVKAVNYDLASLMVTCTRCRGTGYEHCGQSLSSSRQVSPTCVLCGGKGHIAVGRIVGREP